MKTLLEDENGKTTGFLISLSHKFTVIFLMYGRLILTCAFILLTS